ncbi:hypothetical protein D3C81_2121970 [compost metagenome]
MKQPECRERAHLEISQGGFAATRFHRSKGFTQLRVSGFDAINLHPLVVSQQVRRVVHPDFQALRPQQ